MNDDFDNKQSIVVDEDLKNSEISDTLFSDLVADVVGVFEEDLPDAAVVEVRVSDGDCSNPESNVSDDNSGEKGSPNDCSIPLSNISDDNSGEKGSPNDKEDEEEENNDDPISKKRKRQIRYRDAALRSRERKKMYVKELEIKRVCRTLLGIPAVGFPALVPEHRVPPPVSSTRAGSGLPKSSSSSKRAGCKRGRQSS
ncbi:hypothetical protein MKX01_005525 [Papaver californicum]|nr:hypothetical protein MKX01_005525 [Papaver californicum]